MHGLRRWLEIAPPRPYAGSRFERLPAAGLHDLEKNRMIPVTDDLLDRMVRAIVAEVDPEQVILFGSRARGDAREDSDVDLIVVEAEPFGQARSRRRESTRILLALFDFEVPIDILLYSRDEIAYWRDSLNHVLARAVREGRVLYERS